MNQVKIPDEVLMAVTKPARYAGHEINMVKKDPDEAEIRFAFCFPDVYEIGMSNLGLQILYYFLNRREDTYCERVFAPWGDMEDAMRARQIPLFSLETGSPLRDFDFVGFTLQYEMCYTNVLNMLDLSGIALRRWERNEDDPVILCGGTCAYNPEPLADFVDVFYLGEGEVQYDAFLDLYKENKRSGGSKAQFLEKLLALDGFYVPQFYDVTYHEDGRIAAITPNHPAARAVIQKVAVSDFDRSFFPDKQLVPLIDVVHDRVTLEVFRGCIRGCRFCQAGFVYRPVRERNAETLVKQAESLYDASGHEEISLVSLSTSDYTQFPVLADKLMCEFAEKRVGLSLPSLRIDAFSVDLMHRIQGVRKSALTFAPEAGTQRLRDVINKNLTEEEILSGCRLAFEGGWDRVKLYFMIGLPTETDEDLLGIRDLTEKIVDEYYQLPKEQRSRPVSITASASCFVPKPFTPFQWDAQETPESFGERARLIKRGFHKKQIRFQYHETQLSSLEGVMARGDRRLGQAIYLAWKSGCKFDSWSEYFHYDRWLAAFREAGVDPAFYANRKREFDEVLPWDHISVGVTKDFLIRERKRAAAALTTPNCRQECSHCGARRFNSGLCRQWDAKGGGDHA